MNVRPGAICNADRNKRPAPGTYILLTPDGNPISVGFVAIAARTRHPTISNTQTRAAHIFPRAYDIEWTDKCYPSLITDTAPLNEVGGPKKIDSIQNVLLLRSDFHDAWASYKVAVNPDRGHVVIPFTGGYKDIAGKVLNLDHIDDPNHRPLDELFRDHFLQCVLKNMKGAAEATWDYEDTFGDGSMDLSKEIWSSISGKQHLEFEMANRLQGLKVTQEAGL
ncbi:hypothetical protein BJV74DRAFT_825456 [Russula compacta]|nr:hypothetical protein BJV74DRAFT_825456 [Russula compacta]